MHVVHLRSGDADTINSRHRCKHAGVQRHATRQEHHHSVGPGRGQLWRRKGTRWDGHGATFGPRRCPAFASAGRELRRYARNRRLLWCQRRGFPCCKWQPDHRDRFRSGRRGVVGPCIARTLQRVQPLALEFARTEIPLNFPVNSAAQGLLHRWPHGSLSEADGNRSNRQGLYLSHHATWRPVSLHSGRFDAHGPDGAVENQPCHRRL